MFEDVNIKSFKEYIAERADLKEDDDWYNKRFSSSAASSAADEKATASNAPIVNNDEENKKNKTAKTPRIHIIPAKKETVLETFTLETSSTTPQEIRAELKLKHDQLFRTFDSLDDLIRATSFSKAKDANSITPINVTNGRSFSKICDDWFNKWQKTIEDKKTNRAIGVDLKTLDKWNVSDEDKKAAYKRIVSTNKIPSHTPDKEEVKEDVMFEGASVNILEKKKNLMDLIRGMAHPLATDTEISSGTRNKLNSRNILSTIDKDIDGKNNKKSDEEKIGVYGVDKAYIQKIYEDFVKKANVIIYRNRPLGKAYLKEADNLINEWFNVDKRVNDYDQARKISIALRRAWSVLEVDIGRKIDNLMSEYEETLKEIEDELKVRDEKYKESLGSTNAQKTLDKYRSNVAAKEAVAREAQKRGLNPSLEDQKSVATERAERRKARKQARLEKQQKETEKYEQRKVFSYNDIGNYINKRDYSPETIIKNCDNLSRKIATLEKNGDKITDKNFWKSDFNIDDQKKLKALTLLIFADKANELKEKKQRLGSDFEDYLKNNFDEWFKKALSDHNNDTPQEIINVAKEISSPKEKKSVIGTAIKKAKEIAKDLPTDVKKMNDNIHEIRQRKKLKKASGEYAKDFDGEAPEKETEKQPTTIYGFALQQAKLANQQ